MDIHNIGNIHLYLGDALDCYSKWKSPTIIMSDGAFGISGFKGIHLQQLQATLDVHATTAPEANETPGRDFDGADDIAREEVCNPAKPLEGGRF